MAKRTLIPSPRILPSAIHTLVQPTSPMSLGDGHYLLHVGIAMSRSRSPLIGQCDIHSKTKGPHVITGDTCTRMAPWRMCRVALKPEKYPRGVLPRDFHVYVIRVCFRLHNPCIFLCTRGESEARFCARFMQGYAFQCAHPRRLEQAAFFSDFKVARRPTHSFAKSSRYPRQPSAAICTIPGLPRPPLQH